jgi:hypothetical protein
MEIKNISIFIFLVLLTSCSDNENKSNYLDDGFIRFNGFVQKTNLAFSESEAVILSTLSLPVIPVYPPPTAKLRINE